MNDFVIASVLRRTLAYFIDQVILSVVLLATSTVMQESEAAFFLVCMVVTCGYYTCCASRLFQATIGQKLTKIRVIACDGSALSPRIAFDRTISQFLCPALSLILLHAVMIVTEGTVVLSIIFVLHTAVIILWSYWYIAAIFSPSHQTLHDVIYGTIVVRHITPA